MDFLGWMAFCGVVLLLVALSSAYLQRLPIMALLAWHESQMPGLCEMLSALPLTLCY